MICIKDIEVFEIDRDTAEIALHYAPNIRAEMNFNEKIENINIKTEMIHGRTYRNSNGQEVCIGLSKKVQRLLGIPFDDFERLQESNNKSLKEIDKLIKKVNALQMQVYEKDDLIQSVTGNKIKLLDLRKK